MTGSPGIPQIAADFNIIVPRIRFPGNPEPLPPCKALSTVAAKPLGERQRTGLLPPMPAADPVA